MTGSRAPFQVLVLPFRWQAGRLEFAIFERADLGYWQGIAGGGIVGETALDAARREAAEEASIPPDRPYFGLSSMTFVPVVGFRERALQKLCGQSHADSSCPGT